MSIHPPVRDNRIAGANNLNNLVDYQLGSQSYNVVRTVYDNMQWLHNLNENLGSLHALSTHLPSVHILNQHLHQILNVSAVLNEIISVNDAIPVLAELAPRIMAFNESLANLGNNVSEVQTDLCSLRLENSETRHLIDEFRQTASADIHMLIDSNTHQLAKDYQKYAQQLTRLNDTSTVQHRYISQAMPQVKKALDNHTKLENKVLFLTASDAVWTALYTRSQCDFEAAEASIREAELSGACVDVLRERLRENDRPEETNVMNVLQAPESRGTHGC